MSGPIKEALGALSRHADLINAALDAPLDPREGIPAKALSELRQVSALRPASDDTYRLHPKLREYLYDHLQLYPAYQSLSQISADINLMKSLWGAIEEMRYAADADATAQLSDRLQSTVFDIADNMQRNLTQLNNLLSTRYGNVRSIAAKRNQNRWYQQQSANLLRDLAQLSAAGAAIERDAAAFGMTELSRFVRRNLLSLILSWQQALSEMQTLLSKEIFRTREIEAQHRQLARMDIWLRQQPGWMGVEVDIDAEVPGFLLAARLPAIRAHIEPDDSDADIRSLVVETASTLPAIRPVEVPAEPQRLKRKVSVHEPQPMTPAMRASERLYQHVTQAPDSVSLLDWRKSDPDAQTMRSNVWLIFAMTDLRNRKISVAPVLVGESKGKRRSHMFDDAVASGPNRIWESA